LKQGGNGKGASEEGRGKEKVTAKIIELATKMADITTPRNERYDY